MEREIEVMRITRVPPMGQLVVWVGEQSFEKLSDIPNRAVRQRLMAAIGELIVFADGYEALVDAGLAPPLATTVTASTQQPVAKSIEERRAAFLASIENQPLETRPLTDEKIDRSGTAVPESDPESPVALDLATQINAILERKVSSNPLLQGRTIQLRQDPVSGIGILVDGRHYSTPDEIDDQLVRKTLREAVKEWEAR